MARFSKQSFRIISSANPNKIAVAQNIIHASVFAPIFKLVPSDIGQERVDLSSVSEGGVSRWVS